MTNKDIRRFFMTGKLTESYNTIKNTPEAMSFTEAFEDLNRLYEADEETAQPEGEQKEAPEVKTTDNNTEQAQDILADLADMDIPVGQGNVIFPEGNALTYLSEYFTGDLPENPYVDDPYDVRCVSFSPNGDVLGGNVYLRDITDIIATYTP